ncbi:MAG: intradiol ring-cleavage dioxygenase [Pseudomonadota bacterium]|nr:MAG: intradiol ring-cleavage dioxygenase [Pseudomonadota bacterium]
MQTDRQRRSFLLGMAGLWLATPVLARTRLDRTPAQIAGPFYPDDLPLDDDNDLTVVRGRNAHAKGNVSDVSGRILDVNGQPLAHVRVEIWQCDANGRYHHPRDHGGPLDPNFQGFGHTRTDAQGRYRFRTIRPVPYPGRTPHIHFAVFPEWEPRFTTQLYVAGEPRNASDFLFNSIPATRRHLVLAEFKQVPDGSALAASFDIVLGSADGTPRG